MVISLPLLMTNCCEYDIGEPQAEIMVLHPKPKVRTDLQLPVGKTLLNSQVQAQARNSIELRHSRTSLMPLFEEGQYQGDLLLHFHSACLKSPSTKFGCNGCEGVASSFAIISVEGEEITRTGLSTEIDGRSVWDYEHRHKSDNLPKEISVSVWTSNLVGRNVLCGSVTIPCYADMNDLNEVDFILTKSSKPTGTLRLTLQLRDIRDRNDSIVTEASDSSPCSNQIKYSRANSHLSNFSKASCASSVSIGMEMDHLLACTEGRNWVNATVSLAEPKGGFEEANLKLTKQLKEEKPVVRWEVRTDAGWMPWGPGVHFHGEPGEEVVFTLGTCTYKARFESTSSGIQTNVRTGKQRELRIVCDDIADLDDGSDSRQVGSEAGSQLEVDFQEHSTIVNSVRVSRTISRMADLDALGLLPLRVLLGSWKCVETTGLESFLKQTGVNIFQRKIALAARWPSWEFVATDDGGSIRFINHSAVGALKEDIVLNGEEYKIKDGHGNVLVCSSVWEPTTNGGVLRTKRSGPMGRYSEERLVEGDRLNFVLSHGDGGPSWGRSFIRKKTG
mmetsp:Transcript_165528/g.293131  ORF Transcript_165528/g.293131 Transcript_165528/m.293131 type:complete len:560 (-) Transcript_165528:74-1753(-)